MAQVTSVYGEADGGNVRWEYDWNDANGKISQVRCINNSGETSVGWAEEMSTGDIYELSVGPGEEKEQNLPAKFKLTQNPDGSISAGDFEYGFRWPA